MLDFFTDLLLQDAFAMCISSTVTICCAVYVVHLSVHCYTKCNVVYQNYVVYQNC